MAKIKVKTTQDVTPMIYAYTTPGIVYHDGWTKIGYTERDVDARIKEQTQTANIVAKKEWQDVAVFCDGKTRFTDKEFHCYLEKNDVKRKEPQADDEGCPEWFYITGEDSYMMFGKFRRDMGVLQTLGIVPYTLRKEQRTFVEKTEQYYRANPQSAECLWNAKPRFGKTLTTYDLCKKLGASKILIVTNRPSIANSWYDDYVKFLGTESGYYFVSNADSLKNRKHVIQREKYLTLLDTPMHKGCIEFVSLQDLKGSIYFGGQYDKLEEVAHLTWDVLIIDEAHEGVDTYKTDVAFEQIKRKYTLHLSGTPFKALAGNKFPEDAVFNWTYADEQKAKREWDSSCEQENPYANLPQLNLFTYQMSDIVFERAKEGADFDDDGENEAYYFDLNEFFKTNSVGNFVHDADVDKFLDALVCGEKFPFSTQELRDELNHTLWVLRYVSSARALAKKLRVHPVFRDYEIILAAGNGKLNDDGGCDDDAEFDKALKSSYDKVVDAIKKNPKTITISVGQLTTGITIPQWTAVLMLSNMKSSPLYMQAAFRAQNPCLFNVNGKQLRKQNAYVFDFDPARTLTVVEDFANGLSADTANGKGDSDTRKQHVRELLNFFPVYGENNDGEMIALDAEKVLSIPRAIHAKEVVRRGFMSNYLFENVGNIFNAPKEILDILQKFEPTKESIGVTDKTKEELSIGDNGEVELSEDTIVGTANGVFGDKVLGEISDELQNELHIDFEIPQEEQEKQPSQLDRLLDAFHTKLTDNLIMTAKETYGNDMSKSTQQSLTRQINADADVVVKKLAIQHQIEVNTIEAERKKAVESLGNDKAKIEATNQEFNARKDVANVEFAQKLKDAVHPLMEDAKKTIVKTVETDKNNKKRNVLLDNVKGHLRGFSRTIPSFLMAYGTMDTTLENFDSIIPDEVFKEVTSISLDEFRWLRDGFDYQDENGETCHYNGFFNVVVFNDAIKEFLLKKQQLANYFDENQTEDIFDYIPPQKTNQIFTPKKVVKQMVDMLEQENNGCFDDPDKTFIDLYMKSGLYIVEIVKRLFRSEKMKALFPSDSERLNHIFAKQVYGCAPTEIIYRIATAYILGFGDNVKIEHSNFVHFDTLPYAQDGTLETKLDEVFKQ